MKLLEFQELLEASPPGPWGWTYVAPTLPALGQVTKLPAIGNFLPPFTNLNKNPAANPSAHMPLDFEILLKLDDTLTVISREIKV